MNRSLGLVEQDILLCTFLLIPFIVIVGLPNVDSTYCIMRRCYVLIIYRDKPVP